MTARGLLASDRAGPSQLSGQVLEILGSSFELRHSVPPVAWVCFEDMALCARCDENGHLSVAIGVRELAEGLRVTKNTAARAVGALVKAGLIRRARVRAGDGRLRSGYVLLIGRGVDIREDTPNRGEELQASSTAESVCIGDGDSQVSRRDQAEAASTIHRKESRRPDNEDTSACIEMSDKKLVASQGQSSDLSERVRPGKRDSRSDERAIYSHSRPRRSRPRSAANQPSLFDAALGHEQGPASQMLPMGHESQA